MVINLPYADNITITTQLTSCDNTALDINQTVDNLEDLYGSYITTLSSNVFYNVSIKNFNCTVEEYFQQIIVFTQSVSIRIQILFASIYFDYIYANNYQLNGFNIDREIYFNLSSITTNNNPESDACSSGEAAHDPLCLMNLTYPVCTTLSNRWNFVCSQISTTNTTNSNNDTLLETAISLPLNAWKIGLICGLSVLFVLFLILLCGICYCRYKRTKDLALSHLNVSDDVKLVKTSGIPQSQIFQGVTTIVQPKRNNTTAISWIRDGTPTNINRNDEKYISLKPPGRANEVTFIDHAKVHDPNFPSNIPKKPITSVNVPTISPNKTVPVILPTGGSRPISGTSVIQLKAIIDELQEDKLNESDNISLDRSISNSFKKPRTSMSGQSSNLSSIEESLRDEDAWMPILDVVNAELAKLNEEEHHYRDIKK